MMRKAILWAALGFFAGVCWADDFATQRLNNWHQWRGPEATGVAPTGDPPTQWNEQTNIKWKVAILGRGNASPIVWGDRVFVVSAIKTDRQAEPAETSAAAEQEQPFRQVAFAETPTDSNNPADATPAEQPQAQAGEQPAESSRPWEHPRGAGGGGGGGRRGGFGFGGGGPPTNYHQFVVMCLDRNTGQTLWQQTAC